MLTKFSQKKSTFHSSATLMLVFLLSGCFQAQFYSDISPLPAQPDGQIQTYSTVFSAIEITSNNVALRSICPSGVAKVAFSQTLLDGTLHYLSLGFYSPQTAWVWCTRRKM